MIYVILLCVIIAILLTPQWWVRHTLNKYSAELDHIPGTGGQFAQHLLRQLSLSEVKVEQASTGDHYSPADKAVRLSLPHFERHSLVAMVVAAHEVGHAVQHSEGYPLFQRRQQVVRVAAVIEKIAPVALGVAPIVLALTKSPAISGFMFLLAALSIGSSALVHLVTLPVEFDASFNKALPLLQAGDYLRDEQELKAAKQILQAAALTYVAQALFNFLNIAYWMRVLRR